MSSKSTRNGLKNIPTQEIFGYHQTLVQSHIDQPPLGLLLCLDSGSTTWLYLAPIKDKMILLFSFLVAFVTAVNGVEMAVQDRAVLEAVAAEMGYDAGIICDWYSIYCNNDGHVTELVWSGRKLSGSILPSIGQLTYLIRLDLSSNQLRGSIPSSISKLKSLYYLDLSWNFFSGSVKSFKYPSVSFPYRNFTYNFLKDGSCSQVNMNCNFKCGNQRDRYTCQSFYECNSTQINGSCGGHGTCFNGTDGVTPECLCENGYELVKPINKCIDSNAFTSPPSYYRSPTASRDSGGGKIFVNVILPIGTAAAFYVLLYFCCFCRHRPPSQPQEDVSFGFHTETSSMTSRGKILDGLQVFSSLAVSHFRDSTPFKEGQDYAVCKDRYEGQPVLVNRFMFCNSRGSKPFLKAVDDTTHMTHPHLLQAKGLCIDSEEGILLCAMPPNDSVASHLRGGSLSPIPINRRPIIAKEVASAISFLHWECDPPIWHGDLQADAVFLENDWKPVVAKFWSSRIQKNNDCLRMPENLTPMEIDVFSFGEFLIELVVGMSITELVKGVPRTFTFQEWAIHKLQRDVSRTEQVSSEMLDWLERLLRLGFVCIENQGQGRPDMRDCCAVIRGDGFKDILPRMDVQNYV